ncbi:MAG TPA: hypothetical protein VFH61_00295 [Thermoleophilia bacterium]|nr:hypothetical protein [Thermoleophilia bacterium]
MTTPICATLSGSLSGSTKLGALTPIPIGYTLSAQGGHHQFSGTLEASETKVITIPTNLAGPIATPQPMTLFFLTIDVAGVEVTLNSAGVPVGPFQFPQAGGPLVLPGQVGAAPGLPVADIQLLNNGTQRATYTVTAIYGN